MEKNFEADVNQKSENYNEKLWIASLPSVFLALDDKNRSFLHKLYGS